MSGLEIFLLISGFTFIVASFFLMNHEQKQERMNVSLNTDELISKEEMDRVIQEMKERLEDIASNCIIDADDKFSSITNEKIIAINDFSGQLFAKLENNHQEVVFLYNMLQEKEADMKSTLNRMEVLRKENQEFMERMVEFRSDITEAISIRTARLSDESVPIEEKRRRAEKEESKSVLETAAEKKIEMPVSADKKQRMHPAKSKFQQKQIIPEEIPEFIMQDEDALDSKNEKILKLYKQKKSVREISKQLGLGQGEVKLVIDLYGR